MKYAWIEDNKVRDICQGGDPVEHYHPDVAAHYTTQVPDDATNGDGWVNGELVKPVIPEPTATPVSWTADDIRKGLTLAERVKWDNDKSDEIKTAKVELSGINYRAKVQEILNMLVASGDVSQASADAILANNKNDGAIPVSGA
jgi:hypothetical protein